MSTSVSSLLNSLPASSYGAGNAKVGTMTQAVRDAIAKASGATVTAGASASASGVTISIGAKVAAATALDNAKDFSVLTEDVRKSLDSKSADLTEMSGRALSAIILNRGGGFSAREVAGAKAELNGRTRADFTSALSEGVAVDALGAYNEKLVAAYDAMSAEEREARGWTEKVRNSAEAFVAGSASLMTLFDALDAEEQDVAGEDVPGWRFAGM